MTENRLTGGCLCGALRYDAMGPPLYAGLCYCPDCRKASGSGFIGFMGFPAEALTFSGEASVIFRTLLANGREAVRNSCPRCHSLVFGGVVGEDQQHTVYAGSLDDPAAFQPTMAIFTAGRPDWAPLPPELKAFEAMPG